MIIYQNSLKNENLSYPYISLVKISLIFQNGTFVIPNYHAPLNKSDSIIII
jgi:hypothetical protein